MSLKSELPNTSGTMLNEKFFQVAVAHFPYILRKNLFDIKEVDGITGEIYRGDFHGLLRKFNIDPDVHRIITAFNGLLSPIDYQGNLPVIKIPNLEFINNLSTVFEVEM